MSSSSSRTHSEVQTQVTLEEIATIHRGTIEGANFCVGVPKEGETSCLLIHCHGFRSEGMYAEIDDPFCLKLIQQGWTVAVTSYRRTGVILGDAIKDVLNLRNWICCEIGLPAWCFLDGRSMGGAIATRIAEKMNSKKLFDGVLAIGAALMVKEEGSELNHRPTIPILYLNNTSEHGPIENYIRNVVKNSEADRKNHQNGSEEVIPPALHSVHREGHNWTNARERWSAFTCLVEWAFVGSLVSAFHYDGTREPLFHPGTRAIRITLEDGSPALECSVFAVDRAMFHLNVTLADLDTIRVRMNHVISVLVPGNSNHEAQVHVGAYPFVGIADSEVVLCETPEDFMCLFSISKFRNQPAKSVLELGLNLGSKVIIVGKKNQPRGFKRKVMPAPIYL